MPADHASVLQRIHSALNAASKVFARFTPGAIETQYKAGNDPVTEADRILDELLRRTLLRPGEGWLSEESADDPSRLGCARVWVVDPLDGTREFIEGIPEFCVSIALVENGRAIAGGIHNPATQEMFIGSTKTGITYKGKPASSSARATLKNALVLASRSEVKRGEWKRFENAGFQIRPTGSVAYKLALVAAGLADATFTLTPKHEWDVAGGTALVLSAGGRVCAPDGSETNFNRKSPLLPGLVACGAALQHELLGFLSPYSAKTHALDAC